MYSSRQNINFFIELSKVFKRWQNLHFWQTLDSLLYNLPWSGTSVNLCIQK